MVSTSSLDVEVGVTVAHGEEGHRFNETAPQLYRTRCIAFSIALGLVLLVGFLFAVAVGETVRHASAGKNESAEQTTNPDVFSEPSSGEQGKLQSLVHLLETDSVR
eukprot:CAMPEP_0197638568 /NCGR_PEP_ID=MMETSP1338-20131121/13466_1 /TAXON_ID=43686 ORGANISM="Pelagodinium beii, Strain RCC1491" /NCGR_SAMPLE_ID=MMETSP1338 /ASSEMBLY_ACC=CAM_ASM_000754 /LENGTH=105 /DNA_ID=CAMNT_0043211167 /DNA_START=58 /DNA_END=375 /DNA_ORIENTATION=-